MSTIDPTAGRRRGLPPVVGMLGACILAGCAAVVPLAPARSDEPADDGVFLPADRELERSLDKARRLLAESRWSDAAALFDEILAAPRDAFPAAAAGRPTSRSLKAEAWALMQSQPRAGREAYDLLFAGRAERELDHAIAADDLTAIVGVARRWFATPAGRRAAIIAATTALESGQPAVAAAWLDRLATVRAAEPAEPTLSLMRSIARARAGDPAAAARMLEAARGRERVGGTDVTLSMPPGRAAEWLATVAPPDSIRADEWRQPRGDAARNATVAASRPLLVPRYRVPLSRHPEEARLLDARRQAAAAAERFLLPASLPLASDGLILVRMPLGILAVDFTSGKRLWLQPLDGRPTSEPSPDGQGPAANADDAIDWAFDDMTSLGLTAAGGLVFAVESPAVGGADQGPLAGFNAAIRGRRPGEAGAGGNRLRAFDIEARGAPRWQLPAAGSEAWYLGPPLAVGGDLYALVEEKGEVRLESIDAARGTVTWAQPLAELDESEQITGPKSRWRRLAGLSPSLADGVLVCPLGTGTVVAIDLATRTLLWAHRYARLDRPDADRMAVNDAAAARRPSATGDAWPVLAAGRVLLAAPEATGLICLDLHQGRPLWEKPVADAVLVAGVVDGRVIVIGQRAVEARAVDDGGLLWQLAYADAGGRPSGRGLLTPERLLLPLDSPEIVEIELASGRIVGRCAARGGLVPGNLVAYRGEVISRGIDSLDVFHQQATLEDQIRTAEARDPQSPWAMQWRGQLSLEAGRVADGLALLGKAARAAGHRMPPETLPDAIVFGMQRDFAAAAPAWREAFPQVVLEPGSSPAARAAAKVAINGFLAVGAWPDAWAAMRPLIDEDPAMTPTSPTRDPADAALSVSNDRWLAGRLARLVERAPAELRATIAETTAAAVAAAAARGGTEAVLRLLALSERLAPLPAAAQAHEAAVAAIDALGDDGGRFALRREWHLLQIARRAAPESRPQALAAVAEGRPAAISGWGSTATADAAWPLGRVAFRRLPIGRDTFAVEGRTRLMPLPVTIDAAAAVPDLRLACDVQEGRLHLFDGYGRPLLDPLAIDAAGSRIGHPWLPQGSGFEAWSLGRLLFVRTGGMLSAYDLAGGSRPVWTHATAARDQAAGLWHRDLGGRIGSPPLGMEITEPDDRTRSGSARGGRPRITGSLHHEGSSLAAVDPCSGAVLWERHGLPGAVELVGDDDFVTVCTASGADSRVLSMQDGTLVHTCTLPPRRQRITASGRKIVAVRPLGSTADRRVADRVRLELIDPAVGAAGTTVLGEVPGESRAAVADEDRLFVLAPDGQLTIFDLAGGSTAARVQLPSMPRTVDRLQVLSWHDRHLVIAGSESASEAGEWLPGADNFTPLQHLLAAGEMSRPLTGGIWAVDRETGSLLWPAAVELDRHCLHQAQPAGLPVLLLSRQMRGRLDSEPLRLRLVGLDKRTGHAVFEEDAQPLQPHAFFGCELVGDPERHSITLRESGESPRWAVLEFTGESLPPRPPRQSRGAALGLERLLENLLPSPHRRQRP